MKKYLCFLSLVLFSFVLMGIKCNGGDKNPASQNKVTVFSITPNRGATTGGTTITISGANFEVGNTTVTIDGNACTSVQVQLQNFSGLTSLTCVTPAGTTGFKDVVVSTSTASTTVTDGFEYPSPPTLSTIAPNTGNSQGGTVVTISGSDFEIGGTSVSIGGNACTNINVTSPSQLTCTAPAGSTGSAKNVTVSTAFGSDTLTNAFTFIDPPSLSSSLASVPLRIPDRNEVNFSVTATSPPGNNLSLNLLNPPPGSVFTPINNQSSPVQSTLTWPVFTAGVHILHFEAIDIANPHIKGRLKVAIDVQGGTGHLGTLRGDVTGDGVPDLVAGAQNADISGVTDAGAIYVFASDSSPASSPTATLTVTGAEVSDQLGSVPNGQQGIYLVDITGDGIQDVIALASNADINGKTNVGAIYVWVGGTGLTGSQDPDHTFLVNNSVANDQLGAIGSSSEGRSVQFADITGDGITDILVAASSANVNSATDGGAIYLFAGGANLNATVNETAVLAVQNPESGDQLCFEMGFFLAEVTGDSTLDIIAGAKLADVSGNFNAGAVYIWDGSSTFQNEVNPTATLVRASPEPGNQLGFIGDSGPSGFGIIAADVTGDGTNDMIVGCSNATVDGNSEAGAIFIWAGGSTLTGTPSITATLRDVNSAAGDKLGAIPNGAQGIKLADVNNDGTLDIVVGTRLANDTQNIDAGSIFVWAGGAANLTGTVDQTATLEVNETNKVGLTDGFYGFLLADVTGDGIPDIIGEAQTANFDVNTTTTIVDAGVIYIWNGSTTLSGSTQPDSTLGAPDATSGDNLGKVSNGPGIFIREVTGDSIDDIVIITSGADRNSQVDVGEGLVFAGNSSGVSETPTATLVIASPTAADKLGSTTGFFGIQFADLGGDGELEIIVGTTEANINSTTDVGAIYIWNGGTGLTGDANPDARLAVDGAIADDSLISSGYTLWIADITGDANLDVIASTSQANINNVTNVGAAYIWVGSPGFTGNLDATANLFVNSPLASDQLGGTEATEGLRLGDFNEDGVLDILAPSPDVDRQGLTNTLNVGAIYLWTGGSLTGDVNPNVTFSVDSPSAGDQLGR